MADSPDKATTRQLRALHAAGRQRGLSHEDLRAVCGVTSLKDLSRADAAAVLDRLNNDRPDSRRYKTRTTRGLDPGEVRHTGDATSRQRRTILYLLNKLGWDDGSCTHWLSIRYAVDYSKLDATWIDRQTAHEIINALDAAAEKGGVLDAEVTTETQGCAEEIPF